MWLRKDRSNSGNAIVGNTQSQDKLGNWESQNAEMPTPMWQKKSNKRKGQKDSNPRRRENYQMGNRWQKRLGKRGRDRREPQKNQENGPKEVFEVEKSIWEGRVRKDADQENFGSCYRSQRDV